MIREGQAYVVLNGKAIYFGPSGTDEATEKYHQTIAEWMAAGKHIGQSPEDITINEVIARFWKYAQGYYVRPDGTQTYEINNFRQALRPLQALYGTTRAAEFGPRALKPRSYPDFTGRKSPSFSILPHTDFDPLFHYLDMQTPQVVYSFCPSKTGSKHAMNAMVCNGTQ